MSQDIEGILDRNLDGKEKKLQNSEVSKPGGHDSIPTIPHIILEIIKLFSQISGMVEYAICEAFMFEREHGQRQQQVSVLDERCRVGLVSC